MRLVLFLLALAAASLSCAQFFQCQPGQCPTGEECVAAPGTSVPKCLRSCQLNDAGSMCGGGEHCEKSCDNCVPICIP